jgi:hypothetical protein
MARSRLFQRRRDGHVEVKLNGHAREFIAQQMQKVVDADHDTQHPWHNYVHSPMNPSADSDDPLRVLQRQKETASNAELALLTVEEEQLSVVEAWAWLTTMQIALRNHVVARGAFENDSLEGIDEAELSEIRDLQYLLFELARALE